MISRKKKKKQKGDRKHIAGISLRFKGTRGGGGRRIVLVESYDVVRVGRTNRKIKRGEGRGTGSEEGRSQSAS